MSIAAALGWWLLLGLIALSALASLGAWARHLAEREAHQRYREVEGHPLPPSEGRSRPISSPISGVGALKRPGGTFRT
jgi:hypothetical protein